MLIGGPQETAGILSGRKPKKQAEQLSGAWNYLEVRLVGGRASVWLNGTVVAEGVEVKPEAAPLGLRAGGPMQFRNVRLRDLKE